MSLILQVQKHGIIERDNYNIREATRRMDCLQSDSTTAANGENDNSQNQRTADSLDVRKKR